MKPETKNQLLIVAGVALVALVIWQIFATIRAGQATIGKIIMAPFNGLIGAWKAVTGLFSFSSSSAPAVTDDDTAGINNPVTGQPITEDTTIAGIILGNPYQSKFDWTLYNN